MCVCLPTTRPPIETTRPPTPPTGRTATICSRRTPRTCGGAGAVTLTTVPYPSTAWPSNTTCMYARMYGGCERGHGLRVVVRRGRSAERKGRAHACPYRAMLFLVPRIHTSTLVPPRRARSPSRTSGRMTTAGASPASRRTTASLRPTSSQTGTVRDARHTVAPCRRAPGKEHAPPLPGKSTRPPPPPHLSHPS